MSDEQNATANGGWAYKTDATDKDQSRFVDIDDGLRVYEGRITREDSLLKGMIYHYPQCQSVLKAIEKFTEERVLMELNNRLAQLSYARAAATVKSQLSEDKAKWPEEIKQRYGHNPVILTVEEARDFKPGEREQTPQRIAKDFAALMVEAQELCIQGKQAEAMAKMAEASAKMAQLSDLQAKLRQQVESAPLEV